jgi:hypothetical protein
MLAHSFMQSAAPVLLEQANSGVVTGLMRSATSSGQRQQFEVTVADPNRYRSQGLVDQEQAAADEVAP